MHSLDFRQYIVLLEDSRKDETMPHTGSFSITAPRFTAAEETEERLALSSEEREKVVKDLFGDRKSTRLNSSHVSQSRMPSSA